MRGHDELPLGAIPQRLDRPEDLRDDIPRLAQHHDVAEPHPLARHLVGVVQGRHRDGRPGDQDRLHGAERGAASGTAPADADVEQPGVHLLRRVLVGDGPTRGAGRRAESVLLGEGVDLHDDAVDLVAGLVPVLAVVGDVFPDLVRGGEDPGGVADRQPPAGQRLVGGALRAELDIRDGPDAVDDHPQGPGRGDPRVLLPQRPGCGVAWVGEPVVPGRREGVVELRELGPGEEDLTPYLQQRRHIRTTQPVRNPRDRRHVAGHVLPGAAVTAGRRHGEPSIDVAKVDGEPVDLEFTQVTFGRSLRQPSVQFFTVEDVVEAQHPLQVRHRGEVRLAGEGHLLGDRIGAPQLRMIGLKRL